MPRRVRCRICGRTHNWNEHNICVRCKRNKKYKFEYEETIEIIDHREKEEKKHDEKEDKVKADHNTWIRELLEKLIDRRVTFFTKDGTHTQGNVKEIKKDFIILDLTHQAYSPAEAVEVISNTDNVGLESFTKFFLRLDDIVGFGEVTSA